MDFLFQGWSGGVLDQQSNQDPSLLSLGQILLKKDPIQTPGCLYQIIPLLNS